MLGCHESRGRSEKTKPVWFLIIWMCKIKQQKKKLGFWLPCSIKSRKWQRSLYVAGVLSYRHVVASVFEKMHNNKLDSSLWDHWKLSERQSIWWNWENGIEEWCSIRGRKWSQYGVSPSEKEKKWGYSKLWKIFQVFLLPL